LSDPAWARDAERAFNTWNGESTVWLLPELEQKVVWREGPGLVSAIPSEHLDRIDIYHVGENGYVFGHGSSSRFSESRIGCLLEQWLDPSTVAGITTYSPPETVDFEIPTISGEGVMYRSITLDLFGRGMFPITEIDEATRTVRTQWPSAGTRFQTVSPAQESEEMFGPFQRSQTDSVSAIGKDGIRTLFTFAAWPGVFGKIIPVADGVDVLYQRQLMRTIVGRSSQDPEGARVQASNVGRAYISNGTADRLSAWFWPASLGDGDEALCFKAEDIGFKADNPTELFKLPGFRKRLAERVDIRRAWGPIGLLWALLSEQLEEHERFNICQRCDCIIRGQRHKQYCSREDNRICYDARRKLDQRRSRQQRSLMAGGT
jgi:hypothetical protein